MRAEHLPLSPGFAVPPSGRLADGDTCPDWTSNKVPGPFVRIRGGDTVEVTIKNAQQSGMSHNVDFHAVTGPGGGAVTVSGRGEATGFTFRALNPGLYGNHCAVAPHALHISNRMNGLIL